MSNALIHLNFSLHWTSKHQHFSIYYYIAYQNHSATPSFTKLPTRTLYTLKIKIQNSHKRCRTPTNTHSSLPELSRPTPRRIHHCARDPQLLAAIPLRKSLRHCLAPRTTSTSLSDVSPAAKSHRHCRQIPCRWPRLTISLQYRIFSLSTAVLSTFSKPCATLKSFMWPKAALIVSYSRIQADARELLRVP